LHFVLHCSSHLRSSKHSAYLIRFKDPLSYFSIAGRKGKITGYLKVSSENVPFQDCFGDIAWEGLGEKERKIQECLDFPSTWTTDR